MPGNQIYYCFLGQSLPCLSYLLRCLKLWVSIISLLLFGPYIFDLYITFVSSRIHSFQIKLLLQQEFLPIPIIGNTFHPFQ